MAREIERRFLVQADRWHPSGKGTFLKQGYVSVEVDRTIRVRVAGSEAFLTIKGRRTGASALEFEYSIPIHDADEILDTLGVGSPVEKVRYRIPSGDHVWEVDVFAGRNEGLILAEIELAEEGDVFERPEWLGDEVTTDYRYANSRLAQTPFQEWGTARD